ncbi:MAG: 3-phosphoshikimate 1-carboxyvinyltransferase, partial [Verrucomicrobiota bacterium]
MSLPDLIQIVPLEKPVHAEITVPGSKSITNRALILAALAEGEVTLQGALWSEDTQIMVECLQELGFMVNVARDPNEFCNRTITVYGKGGVVPPGGTEQQPLELFVGNAGTAARFLSAFVCLGKGVYRLHGVPRMHERPQAALFIALRKLGYRVESENGNDKVPVKICSSRHESAQTSKSEISQSRLTSAATVSIEESSQFASALLLCAETGNWEIKITGENAEESPYVAMTTELIKVFPNQGGTFQIEPDASSGSYFWAAGISTGLEENVVNSGDVSQFLRAAFQWSVSVQNWPISDWQIDEEFPLEMMNLVSTAEGFGLPWELKMKVEHGADWREKLNTDESQFAISRKDRLGDSIMTLIVVAAFNTRPVPFTDLGRLRVQECERVVALRTELTKCGAKVIEVGDTLTVYPSKLHGAEIETYNDHRMAMCFSILGLKVPGIKIKN